MCDCSFASKVLTAEQRKYCTTRKELLAIITFTRQFRHFLFGRSFIIRTDHNSLVWLLNFKNIEGQLARWIEELSQYRVILQHRAGKDHSNADSLSRIPDNVDPCLEYKTGIPLHKLPCGGCHFCTRAKQQWSTFENDIDYVVPLTVRSVGTHDTGQSILSLSDIYPLEELKVQQKQDPDLKQLVTWLDSNRQPSQKELSLSSPSVRYFWAFAPQLEIKQGILYYRWENGISCKYLFVAPKQMRQDIIRNCHDNRASGHLGQAKTYEKLKKCSIWYGMSQDSKLYVENCGVCNRNKKPNIKSKAPLGQYHAGYPMQHIHMDILGPLPESKRGNKYILMLIDQFTKWLECFPIPNQNSEMVAKSIVDGFLSKFGCPTELHTDQGKNMDGVLIRKLCELLQIAKTRTTPYHPSSNGQIERYNRLVLQTIRCYLKNKQNDWDSHLQQIAGAIRATENRQTGFTPNFMMLGREVTQPIDLMLGTSEINNQNQEIPEYLQSLVYNMSECHQIARENIQEAQIRQKKYYDSNLVAKSYNVGDVVLKIDSATKIGQSSKLKAPWKGPYIVVEVKSPILYKIADRKNVESIVHHDRIKIYKDTEFPGWVKRLRNKILGNNGAQSLSNDINDNAQSLSNDVNDSDIDGLPGLFGGQTNDNASDILMQHQSLQCVPDDKSKASSDAGQVEARPKRRQKMPAYLTDYVQE